jgi:hypothetical protein
VLVGWSHRRAESAVRRFSVWCVAVCGRVYSSFAGGFPRLSRGVMGFLGRYRFLTDVRESFGPIEGIACERPSSTRFLAPGDFGPWVLPTVELVGAR